MSLDSSPTPRLPESIFTADQQSIDSVLAEKPEIYNFVYQRILQGSSPEEVAAKIKISDQAVRNIIATINSGSQKQATPSADKEFSRLASDFGNAIKASEERKADENKRATTSLVVLTSLAAVAVFTFQFFTKEPEAQLSGKPISYWIERLEDLDPNIRMQALHKLSLAEKEDFEPFLEDIEDLTIRDEQVGQFVEDRLNE